MKRRGVVSPGPSFPGPDNGGDGEAFFKALHLKAYPKEKANARQGERILIDGGRCVGVLYPDGVFLKRMKPEHLLRIPPGIAIQKAAIEELRRRDCRAVRAEVEDGRTFMTPFSAFIRLGREFDRGFGTQIVLGLSHWQQASVSQRSLFGGDL